MKSLREMLPRVSQGVIDANPQYSTQTDNQNATAVNVARKIRGSMNSTEAEYAMILEQMKRAGEILRYEFEGITLRWADMRYTPDFVVFVPVNEFIDETVYGDDPVITERARLEIKLIECKGAHIWDRDIVRFKGARAYWPEFSFELHQKTKQGWKRKF